MAVSKLGSYKDTAGVPRPIIGVTLLGEDGEVGDVTVDLTEMVDEQVISNGLLDDLLAAAQDMDTPVPVKQVPAKFETVAANVSTAQMLGSTGAIGDTLEALLVIPSATTVGAITVGYGSTSITVYAGGTIGTDLKPFIIALFDIATPSDGGWKVTTGAGATLVAFGNFT